MQIVVYDLDLNQVSILYTWISLVWKEEYRDTGNFQLELQRVKGMEEIVKPWRYCMLSGSDTVMLILSVEIRENTIIANGCTALHILDRRVSTEVISNENAELAMHKLVTNMSPWPKLRVGTPKGYDDTFTRQTSDDSIFNYCREIATDVDMGFKIVKVGKELEFQCYKPEYDPNIRYSDEFGNVGNVKYVVSDRELANVAFVAGALTESGRTTIYAGDTEATGADRLELYVDARDLQQDEGESLEQYKKKLESRGLKKLAQWIHVESLDFTPYNDIANLGDLINIKITSLNMKFSVRVMEVEIVHQKNKIERTITVGSPIII